MRLIEKCTVFFVNVVFACIGFTLFAIGVYILLSKLSFQVIQDISDGNAKLTSITFMAFGAILYFNAFLGCRAAFRNSRCMFITYSITMLLLMITKMTLALVLFAKRGDMLAKVMENTAATFTNNRNYFHNFEIVFHCCGTDGVESYELCNVPDSCCDEPPCSNFELYKGCSDIIQDFVNKYSQATAVAAIVIAVLELAGAIYGLHLAKQVRMQE